VVAIDGGSKDRTADMLTRAGAEVYEHPYLKHYHDQQSIQRNISFSYVADGTPCIFMDVDECFSKELSDYLYFLAEQRDVKYGLISRKTFNYYADITDPTKRIKDYPDFQPRYYVWDKKFKFVNGAHHWTLNCPEPVKIQKDIIHFEKEGKNRDDIETQWKNMMDGVRKYAN
jgi:glycosyltransferase involved in cell wall biosynthesis